jgi:type I restriction enzyme S subunit
VEELLAGVNVARERLARVSAILKRFRQSVLAAACSGRLTAERREAKGDAEPVQHFLKRLIGDRRQLPEVTGSDDIPPTWAQATFGFLAEPSLRGGP